MTQSHTPKGFRSLTPYLIVEDADRLVKFLVEAFDAHETLLMRGEDGTVMHAAFRISDSMIELATAKEPWSPMKSGLHLYVPDTDATYARALKAGGTPLYEPKDMFYGERSGGVADPCGNQWYIATVIEELSVDELTQRSKKGCH